MFAYEIVLGNIPMLSGMLWNFPFLLLSVIRKKVRE